MTFYKHDSIPFTRSNLLFDNRIKVKVKNRVAKGGEMHKICIKDLAQVKVFLGGYFGPFLFNPMTVFVLPARLQWLHEN